MNDITVYSFYNNKGGVGKTTLCSHVSTLYAKNHPETMVLVIDMCPQANISQFLLGGGNEGNEQIQISQQIAERKNIVGFIEEILNSPASFSRKFPNNYAIQANKHNKEIKKNVYLVAGDSFLEALVLSLNHAILSPKKDTWKNYMTLIRKLCEQEFDRRRDDYKNMVVFIDCNPSFSIYTQMALLSSDRLIIPMMADYSSIEGIKGIFMLLYGQYPSIVHEKYAKNLITFDKQVSEYELKLPIIHQFVFNNYIQNNGVATAYKAIQNDLNSYCYERYRDLPHVFTKMSTSGNSDTWKEVFVSEVKDFHSAGKVAMARGIPMCELENYLNNSKGQKIPMPDGSEVQLTYDQFSESIKHIERLESRL